MVFEHYLKCRKEAYEKKDSDMSPSAINTSDVHHHQFSPEGIGVSHIPATLHLGGVTG